MEKTGAREKGREASSKDGEGEKKREKCHSRWHSPMWAVNGA